MTKFQTVTLAIVVLVALMLASGTCSYYRYTSHQFKVNAIQNGYECIPINGSDVCRKAE